MMEFLTDPVIDAIEKAPQKIDTGNHSLEQIGLTHTCLNKEAGRRDTIGTFALLVSHRVPLHEARWTPSSPP